VDKASLLGILIGAAALGFVFFEVSHGHFEMFFSLEGVLMVGCGSISVVLMAMPLEKVLALPGYIKKFLFHKGMSAVELITLISTLSDKARKDGILALESEIEKIKDPFLAAGLKMAIDGVDPSNI